MTRPQAAFEGLLHTASAAVDRLQLIGPECIGGMFCECGAFGGAALCRTYSRAVLGLSGTPVGFFDAAKGTAPFDMATSYLHIIKQAVDKFGELLEGKVPVTPGSLLFDSATTSEEMDAAFKEVVDAINAASGPFSSIKGPEADADDPNSPTTATQIMLPKFELIVSEGEAVQRMGNETVAAGEVKEETERGEAAAEVSRETKPEATSDAPAIPESTLGSDMGALEIQPAELELQAPKRGTSLGTIKALASKGSKNHLEVDTEAGKKKLDKRTSKEKLEDAVAGALEQLSEARSPADDWVLAGSPSASRRSLVSSRQASSSSIIRKPKLLPQVSDLMQEPPLEEIVDGLATSEAESANETSCVVKDGASIEVVDDGGLVETAKASEMEAEVEFEAGDDEEATPTCPTHVAAEPLPGPWSDATTIRGSIASLIPETIPEDSPIVIPARGQSLRNPISQASAASEREPPPPRRSDSLRLSHSPSHSHLATSQSMTFRRSTSVGRSPSQGSFALTPAHHAETLPTNIIEAQNVNSTIWKEYLNITAEFKDRNEPVPVELVGCFLTQLSGRRLTLHPSRPCRLCTA